MSFTLDKVVPWGRLFSEYQAMFALTEGDVQKKILGCSDGPASFNVTLTQQGGQITSVDPIYQFTAAEIQQRFDEAYTQIVAQLQANQHEFIWDTIPSVTELAKMRSEAMGLFINDYERGKKEGRYQAATLPTLPFPDHHFDLALCSHFLFLYSPHFTADFHLQSIKELCRVAHELRIFPLLELGAVKSRHLDAVLAQLNSAGYKTEITTVPYQFQKGGNQMLTVHKPQ